WFANRNSTRHITSVTQRFNTKVKEQKSVVFDFVGTWNTVWVGSVITSQNHSIKTHFVDALFFHFKLNHRDDVCFGIVECNVVKSYVNSLIRKLSSNQHFVDFVL